MKSKKRQTLRKLKRAQKIINKFLLTTIKNYKNMRKQISKIFLIAVGVIAICLNSCNVTRKVTTQSEYTQKGDTSIMIVTKTIESYDATKKGGMQ